MKALSEKITESIESLRWIAPSSSAGVARVLLDSADALQELHFLYKITGQRCDDWETEARNARRQRDEARTEVERLKTELAQAIPQKPEPSRLEIAAMVLNGLAADHMLTSSREECIKESIYMADALITAAKEVTK
jgi:hypothetical protein